MWDLYKQMFATVQFVATAASWAVYQGTDERAGPAAVLFVSLQLAAAVTALCLGRHHARKRPPRLASHGT